MFPAALPTSRFLPIFLHILALYIHIHQYTYFNTSGKVCLLGSHPSCLRVLYPFRSLFLCVHPKRILWNLYGKVRILVYDR